MARLPVVGGDNDTWGTVLNTYLQVSHNTDGTLTTASVATAGAPTFTAIPIISVQTFNYSMGSSQGEVVLANASGGAFNVTLPSAIGNKNIYVVKKTDSSAHNVTVTTSLFQTIDGGSTAVLKVQYVSLSLVSDGSNWLVI